MLVNEASQFPKELEDSTFLREDDEAFLSNQMLSFTNLNSFNDNLNRDNSNLKEQLRDAVNLSDSFFVECQISLIYTSMVTFKNFQIMRNQFLLIFKVNYPEEFFKKVYDKKYFTIFSMDKSSKELVSFAVIDIKSNTKSADILALGVVKEYQNKKLGSNLLRKVIEELTSMGINEVSLIVQQVNENAIRLYQNFGFKADRELQDYYTFNNEKENHAYLMRKTLISKKFWIFDVFKKITDKVLLKNKITKKS